MLTTSNHPSPHPGLVLTLLSPMALHGDSGFSCHRQLTQPSAPAPAPLRPVPSVGWLSLSGLSLTPGLALQLTTESPVHFLATHQESLGVKPSTKACATSLAAPVPESRKHRANGMSIKFAAQNDICTMCPRRQYPLVYNVILQGLEMMAQKNVLASTRT